MRKQGALVTPGARENIFSSQVRYHTERWRQAFPLFCTYGVMWDLDGHCRMRQVCFSSDGKLLTVACEDKFHTVMVFRWEEGLLRCQARLGVKKALAMCFSLDGQELIAAGHKHFKVGTRKTL